MDRIRDSMVRSIGSAMPSILILLMIGALAGTWLLSGVVPTLIYYGLKIFHPKIFLFATVIITGMVSLATGSSWSTVATIGIALIGVGQALGINEGLIAGAVISGAYFGDKMSPTFRHHQPGSCHGGNRPFYPHQVHDHHHRTGHVAYPDHLPDNRLHLFI